jgi:hypothetical protein
VLIVFGEKIASKHIRRWGACLIWRQEKVQEEEERRDTLYPDPKKNTG